MIKWKFILIRLSLLALIVAAIHYGTTPALEILIKTGVQMVTRSKLEMADFKISPFAGRISTGRVQLAHPDKPMENLLDLENSRLQFDLALLLRKKFTVTNGVINGFRIRTGRETSGQLEPAKAGGPSLVNDYLKAAGDRATRSLTSLLNRRFEENFETVRVSREVLTRWPREYGLLIQQGKQLEAKIKNIQRLVKEFQDNPLNSLRDLPRIEQGFRDADRIRQQIADLKTRVSRYRTQVLADRENILAAKDRDLARIQEIKTQRKLNGRTISQLIVGDQQGQRVDQAIAWVKWLRRTFPSPQDSLEAERSRGMNIRFAGQVDRPDFLVRSLKISGQGRMEGKDYSFTGTVAGLTTQPDIYGKPAYLKLLADGNVKYEIHGMIDRTGPVKHDRIIVRIPGMKIAGQTLDLDDAVKISLGRASLNLVARVDLVGDRLTGRVTATQSNVRVGIDSDLENDFAQQVKATLNQDLQTIRQFQIVAKLSGTVDKPRWELESNLGPQIATAVNRTLVKSYEGKKAELAARLDSETGKALEQISDILQRHEAKVTRYLTQQSRELLDLQTRVSSLLRANGLRFR